jgi:lipopolysaccharide transport protein LptA
MKRNSLYLLFAFSFLLPAYSQEERVTEITSEKLFFDYEGKQAIFTGNVVVNDPDLQLTGDKLTVYLTEEDDIERLLAEGNVEIRMEGMQSRSGKAVYTLSDGKVLLTERPQVSRDGSVLQAEKITYWRLENRLEAFPRARVIMFQEQE